MSLRATKTSHQSGREPAASRVRIRSAGVADSEAIFSLIRELADHEGALAHFGLTHQKLKRLLSDKSKRMFCLLALSGEHAVGLALWIYAFSSLRGSWILFVEDLIVTSEFRGRGIGKRLLREVAKRAARERCPAVAWVARNSNRGAVGFYKSLAAVQHKESSQFILAGEALARLAKGAA